MCQGGLLNSSAKQGAPKEFLGSPTEAGARGLALPDD